MTCTDKKKILYNNYVNSAMHFTRHHKTRYFILADFDSNSDIGFTDFGDLPFGACEDPVR